MQDRAVQVLLVEDDEVDVQSMRRSFQTHRIANPLTVAKDGEEALAMLRGQGGYDRLPRPVIILLDLNLPKMDGLEFLEALRSDADLSHMIVFVLTVADDERYKAAACERQVAGYLVKSRVGEGFTHLMSMLGSYWRYVELPPETGHVRA